MGLRKLKILIEQEGGIGSQLSQLDAQIDQATLELKQLKSSPGGTIAGLEKQLSAIYKQIDDTKQDQFNKAELAYFEGLVKKAEEILDQIWEAANQEGLMEQDKLDSALSLAGNPNQALKDQVLQLKNQIVAMRKQERQAKQNFEDQKKLKNKQKELEKVNKEKEEYQTYSSEKESKITSSLNTRIDNAQKALKNIQSRGGEGEETEEISEQQVSQLTPKQEKEKKRLEKLVKNLTNELNGINKRMSKYTVVAEDTMSGLQGGYPDVSYGDDSDYHFQSKGPLGSEPELEDEGFTTFYGDSDSHWDAYNFSSDGSELGEDPETILEDRHRVNYGNIEEKFASKAQARYFYAKSKEPGKEGKKWKKWSKEFADDTEDFSELPEKKNKKEGTMRDFDGITNEASFPVYRYCKPKNAPECSSGCQEGKKCTKVSDCGSSGCCECKVSKTKKGKKNKKDGRIKELQVWGINSNPGFGLGDVPRDKMYSDVPRPAHMNVMGISEMKKPKMKKGKLLEYLSELTTRGGSKGKVYKKKDLTKESGPYTEKATDLEEIKKIISKLAENKQSLQEVPIDYEDRPERINPDIERQLSTQDTAFGKDHPAFPKVGEGEVYDNYEELIASQRFKDVVDTFKRYTGIEGNATDMQNLMGLQGMMMQSLQNTLRIEASNKQRLEDLAVEIVTKDLNVPEGSLQFDVEITGMKKLSKDDMKQKPKNKEESLEQEEETLDHIEDLDLEVAKRRFINSMMQGSAKKALYLYHMVSDELNTIDPTLMNLYGVVISANDLMYWIMPDMMGAGGGEGAPVFGKEKIDLSTTPPTVVAKGMTFPVLVHELHKGVMEYLSLHGLPGDKELRQKVMDKTDFLEDEMWDLRLGPGLWERFIDAIGFDDFDVKNHLYSEIIQMPAKQFLEFMKEIQSGSDKGKQMMVDLAKKIKEDIQKDEYEDATGEYEEEEPMRDMPGFEGTMDALDDISVSSLFPPSSSLGGEVILDIDTILDKISDKGMESLTPEELQFLKDQ
jgi:hypothetical protein